MVVVAGASLDLERERVEMENRVDVCYISVGAVWLITG